MTLKYIIDKTLNEGIAEVAGQKGLNLPSLNNYLKEAKIQLKNKNNLEEFKKQYPNLNIFINRAFAMYNKVLQNGYQVDNTKNNFDNSIMPILKNFYNSL